MTMGQSEVMCAVIGAVASPLVSIAGSWILERISEGSVAKTAAYLSEIQKMKDEKWGLEGNEPLISDSCYCYRMNALLLRCLAFSGVSAFDLSASPQRIDRQKEARGEAGDSPQRRRFARNVVFSLLLVLTALLLACVLLPDPGGRVPWLGINVAAIMLIAYAGTVRFSMAFQTDWHYLSFVLAVFAILDILYAVRTGQGFSANMAAILALTFVFAFMAMGMQLYAKIKPHFRLEEVFAPIAAVSVLSVLLTIVIMSFIIVSLIHAPFSLDGFRGQYFIAVFAVIAILYLIWLVNSRTIAERVILMEYEAEKRLLGESLERARAEFRDLRLTLMFSPLFAAETLAFGCMYLSL